ncbi:MAG: hypothetical protein ACREJS_05210, partial [Candidatus Rokuibacteriota bacterium]
MHVPRLARPLTLTLSPSGGEGIETAPSPFGVLPLPVGATRWERCCAGPRVDRIGIGLRRSNTSLIMLPADCWSATRSREIVIDVT